VSYLCGDFDTKRAISGNPQVYKNLIRLLTDAGCAKATAGVFQPRVIAAVGNVSYISQDWSLVEPFLSWLLRSPEYFGGGAADPLPLWASRPMPRMVGMTFFSDDPRIGLSFENMYAATFALIQLGTIKEAADVMRAKSSALFARLDALQKAAKDRGQGGLEAVLKSLTQAIRNMPHPAERRMGTVTKDNIVISGAMSSADRDHLATPAAKFSTDQTELAVHREERFNAGRIAQVVNASVLGLHTGGGGGGDGTHTNASSSPSSSSSSSNKRWDIEVGRVTAVCPTLTWHGRGGSWVLYGTKLGFVGGHFHSVALQDNAKVMAFPLFVYGGHPGEPVSHVLHVGRRYGVSCSLDSDAAHVWPFDEDTVAAGVKANRIGVIDTSGGKKQTSPLQCLRKIRVEPGVPLTAVCACGADRVALAAGMHLEVHIPAGAAIDQRALCRFTVPPVKDAPEWTEGRSIVDVQPTNEAGTMLLCLCHDGTTHLISSTTGALLNTFVPTPPPPPDAPGSTTSSSTLDSSRSVGAVLAPHTAFYGPGARARASSDGDVLAVAFQRKGDVVAWNMLAPGMRVRLVGLNSAAAAKLMQTKAPHTILFGEPGTGKSHVLDMAKECLPRYLFEKVTNMSTLAWAVKNESDRQNPERPGGCARSARSVGAEQEG
jgi:hypothetical protein